MLAYHFTSDKPRDGSPIPPIGKWLIHKGKIVPCESGLHASESPFDALQYAPGNMLHLVEIEGSIQTHGDPVDKIVGRKRKILKTIDATELLRSFARAEALSVAHLWDMPPIVRQYLETGDETLRDAAYYAADSAARSAAYYAANYAANYAARERLDTLVKAAFETIP